MTRNEPPRLAGTTPVHSSQAVAGTRRSRRTHASAFRRPRRHPLRPAAHPRGGLVRLRSRGFQPSLFILAVTLPPEDFPGRLDRFSRKWDDGPVPVALSVPVRQLPVRAQGGGSPVPVDRCSLAGGLQGRGGGADSGVQAEVAGAGEAPALPAGPAAPPGCSAGPGLGGGAGRGHREDRLRGTGERLRPVAGR